MMQTRTTGFTLVELISIMIMIGILAVVALPRFFDSSTFEARAFSDQTLAILRYAQKAAIAQRRTVCVTFTSTTVSLTMAAAAGTNTCGANPPLLGPGGENPYQITAKSNISFSATPAAFYFTSLGQASVTQTIQVSGAPDSITVERETGYVHP